jgi:hypothetical protein
MVALGNSSNIHPTYYRFSFVLLVISDLICNFAASNVKYIRVMEIKKVTYEEALARFKRSLEIKRNAVTRRDRPFVSQQ